MTGERIGRHIGLPVWAIVGLAALGVPRAVAHDLGPVDPVVNALLVFVPVAIWVVVALWRRVENVVVTLLAVGVCYGVFLGVVHQLLWHVAFDAEGPSLGGNLEGALPSVAEEVVVRGFSFVSSVVTGMLVGAVAGVAAWLLARVFPTVRRPRRYAGPR